MITSGDEYPLHQSSRPIRDAGTERNLYDRFFFNGYTPDGSLYFAVAHGQYPHRNVMDAGFSVIVDGTQHNLHASRLLGHDRLDLRVGPIRISILEPLRRLRIDVDDDASGLKASLTFQQRSPIFEEPHYLAPSGYRSTFDITRMTQNGTWEGSITVGDRTIPVDPGRVWGTRDRSWGVRGVGERESGGAPDALPGAGGFYWLWAPLNFADQSVLFDVNEHPNGRRWHESAMVAAIGDLDAEVQVATASYDLAFKSGTRHAKSFDLTFDLPTGTRTYALEPVLTFYMHGIGYGHPQYGHGMYVGEDVRAHDSFVTAEVDEAAPGNQHIQALVQATRDDGAVGSGILEQLIFGPHEPSGLTGVLDMHE